MDTKKYVILICEGITDKTALSIGLNNYLKYKQINSKVKFKIYNGDITLNTNSNKDVISRISLKISDYINEISNQEKILLDDILAIGTISDLDACFINDDKIVYYDCEKTIYDFNENIIKCKDVVSLRQRNYEKYNALLLMSSENKIKITFKNYSKLIPYRAFYFNVNIEHALYNEVVNDVNLKFKYSMDFSLECKNDKNKFYDTLSSIPTISTKYLESWNEIKLKMKPLDRLTNIICLIQWIEELSAAELCFSYN